MMGAIIPVISQKPPAVFFPMGKIPRYFHIFLIFHLNLFHFVSPLSPEFKSFKTLFLFGRGELLEGFPPHPHTTVQGLGRANPEAKATSIKASRKKATFTVVTSESKCLKAKASPGMIFFPV